MKKIGILAIQGSVIEHRKMFKSLKVEVQEVRHPHDMEDIHGIILPGGESTTQSKLLERFGLFDVLKKKIEEGLPVWGTCAGAILLARKVTGKNIPKTLAVMDITADRNAYGAQKESFIDTVELHIEQKNCSTEAVFIRAPQLKSNTKSVEILGMQNDVPIMLRQKNMLVTAFHPELTDDTTVHKYFLTMCQ